MPGYHFSGKPTGTGWDPDHIARLGQSEVDKGGHFVGGNQ